MPSVTLYQGWGRKGWGSGSFGIGITEALVDGVSTTSAVGSVTFNTQFTVTGVSMVSTAQSVAPLASLAVTGVLVQTTVSGVTAVVEPEVYANPTGVLMTSSVGSVIIWKLIDDSQAAVWVDVDDSEISNWVDVTTSSNTWVDVPN